MQNDEKTMYIYKYILLPPPVFENKFDTNQFWGGGARFGDSQISHRNSKFGGHFCHTHFGDFWVPKRDPKSDQKRGSEMDPKKIEKKIKKR